MSLNAIENRRQYPDAGADLIGERRQAARLTLAKLLEHDLR